MKLFFLLIPFLGVQCIPSAFAHKKELPKKVEKVEKVRVSCPLIPGNLLISIN